MVYKSTVYKSIFQNFKNSTNGGVFNFNDFNIAIRCSYFSDNSVSQSGGCIYSKNSKLSIEQTSFFRCCSLAHTDNIKGNIAYITKSDADLNNIEMMLCGYSDECCSDSTIAMDSGVFTVTYINSTNNYGIGGGAGYSIFPSEEKKTYAHFGNIINGKDDYMAEVAYNPYTIKMTNFINCSECHIGVFYQGEQPYLFTLVDCIIMNIGDVILCRPKFEFYAINTYADKASGSVQITEKLSTHDIILQMKCKYTTHDQQSQYYFSVFCRSHLFSLLISL